MSIKSKIGINRNTILVILVANFLSRLAILLFTNLGNDEVYYVQYALNPAISHFDHPPLVGFLIRLSTFFNLHYVYDDFFVRLGSLLIGTVNIYIIYKIGVILKDTTAGLISALLYSSSFYASIIVGTFILPDTPLSLFWLLSILAFLRFISYKKYSGRWLIIFGITVGFGMLSKYQAAFLWIGAILYFAYYHRKIFLTPKFWISALMTFIIFSPVIYWNLNSEYSGIAYHSERVGGGSLIPTHKHFFPEFFGQIFYNNPLNVFLIAIAVFQIVKLKVKNANRKIVFLLSIGLPLIILMWGMSLYNHTLPHWSGPSYFSLMLVAAHFCVSEKRTINRKTVRNVIILGVFFFYLTLGIGLVQIKTGLLAAPNQNKIEKVGRNDFVVDLGLWKKISKKIKATIKADRLDNSAENDFYIFTHNWFPAAHIDYYYALRNDVKLFVLGDYKKLHEYMRINELRGDIPLHSDAYYITTSNYYQAPKKEWKEKFENTTAFDVIPVKLNGETRVNLFIWKLSNLKAHIALQKQRRIRLNPGFSAQKPIENGNLSKFSVISTHRL